MAEHRGGQDTRTVYQHTDVRVGREQVSELHTAVLVLHLAKVWPHMTTVEPPNKGHFGVNSFVPRREVIPITEVKLKY